MPGPRLCTEDTARIKAEILISKVMVQQNRMPCKQVSAINHLKADKGWLKLPLITYENN